MTPSRRLLCALCFAALVVSTACTAPPEKELHQAEGAIETARAAGAVRYAPDAFRAAEAALTRANAAVADRDYKQALSHALDARESALTAARSAAETRARVRGELEQRIADIEAVTRAFDARVAEAEAAKVPRQALASARAVSAGVTKAIASARPLLNDGADDKAEALLAPLDRQLTQARSEIDAAIAERSARRPVRRNRR